MKHPYLRHMKTNTIITIFCILTCLTFSDSSFAQNIKFYTSNPSVSVSSIDFDTDLTLNIAIKADSALQGYDMLMFTTTLSRKNGKRKWQKTNNLMPETFYGKLKEDGFYHFVALRTLGGGLSYSGIGLSDGDLRFGKVQMNISLYGKKKLNTVDVTGRNGNTDVNFISTTNGYIQYEADIIDFSLPVTLERYSHSANIRVRKNTGITLASIGVFSLIMSPLLILLRVL